jgi:tetratricopeptide (TPR) repeat protein
MKKHLYIALACSFACFFILACSSSDYDVKNFDKFRNIAEKNGESAINSLRYFVYHNSEHAEGNLLLGKLFMDNAKEDRDYYLSQFYLQEAVKYAKDQAIADEAVNLRMKNFLLRGSTIGDPNRLLEIAKFVENNNQLDLAARDYLRAAQEFIVLGDMSEANNAAQNSMVSIEKFLAKGEKSITVNIDKKFLLANHILAVTNIVSGNYETSLAHLKKIVSQDAKYTGSNILPDVDFIVSLVELVNKHKRQGMIQSLAIWSAQDEIDERNIILKLDETESKNRNIMDVTRYNLSLLILERAVMDIDTSKIPQVAEYLRDQILFYSQIARPIE